MNPIRIISLNTWKCDGDYPHRIKWMAQELQSLNPGIIGLQECFASEEGKVNTLEFLSQELGMNFHFLPGRKKMRLFNDKWVESDSGLGILTTFPILESREWELPPHPEDPDRKVLDLEISIPNSLNIRILNTHLTHLSKPSLFKKSQFDYLGKILSAYPENPSLILGDFNTEITSIDFHEFLHKNQLRDTDPSDIGLESRNTLLEAQLQGKNIAVDYILSKGFPPGSFRNSCIVLNKADPMFKVYPSDHFGVMTELYS